MTEITCPTCNGEKYFDEITNITIEGNVWTKSVDCERCDGNGWIEDKQGYEWLAKLEDAGEILMTIYEPDASEYDKRLGECLIEVYDLLQEAWGIIKDKRVS